MLQNTLATSSRRLWTLRSGAAHAINSTSTRTSILMSRRSVTMVATTAAVFLWYLSSNPVYNDAAHTLPSKLTPAYSKPTNSTGVDEDGVLCAVVWGSNK